MAVARRKKRIAVKRLKKGRRAASGARPKHVKVARRTRPIAKKRLKGIVAKDKKPGVEPKNIKKESNEPVQKGEVRTRKRINVSIPQPEVVKSAIDTLVLNERAVEYLKKNVSKRAVDVITILTTPKTDEFLAEQLGMKINAIRRILNIMQGYGITNYYISKNTNGWLSFAWYINTSKLSLFLDYIESIRSEKAIVNSECNDYFICNNCYKNDKFVFTFDAAFEAGFKCSNGHMLERVDRYDVEKLLGLESGRMESGQNSAVT